jgi:LysM repeat protein
MKRILFLLLCLPALTRAQEKPLIVEGTSPGLYLSHTVAPKENYYSIGRMYNISPKEIAPFNKLELEKGLSIGQTIKIPLTDVNFIQSGKAAADESTVAVWHVVKEKEGLYRVALNHNKLPLQTLKDWNNIKTDAVSNGTRLVVGYLKVKTDQSPLSAKAVSMESVVAPVAATTPKVTPPPPVVKQEPVKEEPKVVRTAPVEKPVVTEPVKEAPKTITETPDPKPVAVNTNKPVDFKGGAFKSLYEGQPGSASRSEGQAGIFKTTSGWNDGKYYCLYNEAAPNTIIKITSSTTGKSIYAKVLDAMPDIKQNTGLLVRISNAAATELGVGENNFNCVINYTR